MILPLSCCKDKEPKGEICIIGDVGNEMCASGSCGERFPWWFMLIYPPSAISIKRGLYYLVYHDLVSWYCFSL